MHNGVYTDIDEFTDAVNKSSEIHRDLDLQGAPANRTIGTLIEMNDEFDLQSVITSHRHDLPYPTGADFNVTSVHEFADLIKTLGGSCITDIEQNDDGSAQVGYHFD